MNTAKTLVDGFGPVDFGPVDFVGVVRFCATMEMEVSCRVEVTLAVAGCGTFKFGLLAHDLKLRGVELTQRRWLGDGRGVAP